MLTNATIGTAKDEGYGTGRDLEANKGYPPLMASRCHLHPSLSTYILSFGVE